ncbi:MAG: cell division protein PerM [Microbacteriaceae bacterium]
MTRSLTALFAALEALLVVGIGIGIPLVPLTILWAFQYGLVQNWLIFWRASVDIWLMGSGVDIAVIHPPLSGVAGAAGAAAGSPFTLTIGLLGFALLSILLGLRAGRRIAETPYRQFGVMVTIVTFAVLTTGATLSAVHPAVSPSAWQGILLPTLIYAIGVMIGSEITRRRQSDGVEENGSSLRDWVNDWPASARLIAASGLRAGTAAAAAVLAIASVLVTGLILFGYARIISLYEEIQAGVLGGIALTLGQLAVIPNLVVWAASWLIGPGFAIGTGSTVSPLGTSLGPIPAVPILGALPAGALSFGFVGLLVPVVAGFFSGVVIRRQLARSLEAAVPLTWSLAAAFLAGIVGGGVLGLLAWASGGAAGPGRLADVGPSPLLVGVFAAIEFGIPAFLGALSAGRMLPERSWSGPADSPR